MKKKYFLCLAAFIIGILSVICYNYHNNSLEKTSENLQKVDIYTKQLIKSNNFRISNNDTRLSWEKEKNPNRWTYYNGILLLALIKTDKYSNFVDSYYRNMLNKDGTVDNSANHNNASIPQELDSVPQVRTLLYLSNSKNFNKYELAINDMYKSLQKYPTLKECGGNFYHQPLSKWWQKYPLALDGIYMALPFILEYENFYHKPNFERSNETIFKRMNWVSHSMVNRAGLYDHVISYDGNTTNGISWLRAIGWYAMAQVDIIENMPEGKYKEIMINQLKVFFDNMLKKQNYFNGMWRNVVYTHDKKEFLNNFHNGKNCNYYETSGSAMMAYALLKAYNNNYVNDKKYAFAGIKSFNGIVSNNLIEHEGKLSLKNIYRSTGASDNIQYYKACSGYLEDEAKGIAPLIMASSEVKKLLDKLQAESYK